MQGAGKVQQPDHGKGQHVGGHGQWQHQGPAEKAPSGEIVHGREPGQRDAKQQYADADAGEQDGGVGQQGGQDDVTQVLPEREVDLAEG